jgi:hypothetical protein
MINGRGILGRCGPMRVTPDEGRQPVLPGTLSITAPKRSYCPFGCGTAITPTCRSSRQIGGYRAPRVGLAATVRDGGRGKSPAPVANKNPFADGLKGPGHRFLGRQGQPRLSPRQRAAGPRSSKAAASGQTRRSRQYRAAAMAFLCAPDAVLWPAPWPDSASSDDGRRDG